MKRKSFEDRVREVEDFVIELKNKGRTRVTLEELMDVFKLSANYLRDIIKILLIKHPDWEYKSRVLILERS